MCQKYKIVSLFSGCGGFDLGFIKSGFEVIWANDFFKDAVETYKKNIGEHIVFEDITKISSSQIPNDFDVLIGGFPCQGFSVANTKRNMNDERNYLYKEFVRIIKDKKPKFFIAENVKGLLSMQKGDIIKMIVNDFKKIGYDVDYKVLNASDYGVPQNRERVFIIGNNIGVQNIFPKKTHGFNLLPYFSVKDSIGYLSDVRTRDVPFKLNNKIIYNHIARLNVQNTFYCRKNNIQQSEICDYLKYWKNKKEISISKIDEILGYKYTAGHWFRKDEFGSIPNKYDWLLLKKILDFDDKYDKIVTSFYLKDITFEQSLRISNWVKPSDTITATGPEIHPNKERRLSVRECAILQTFPDDFVFEGSTSNMYKQIGNAVPVLLAEKIANIIKKQLDNHFQKTDVLIEECDNKLF